MEAANPKGERSSIKPKISEWRFKDHERVLFDRRELVPNWRLADKSRRVLADTTRKLSESIQDDPQTVEELRPKAREFASISAGGIAVRSAGSALVQVGAGYVVEAGGSLRRIIEARMNVEAVLKDRGPGYALRFLEGKGSKLQTLSGKGRNRAEVEALSRLTHADTRGLRFLHERGAIVRKEGAEVAHSQWNVYPAVDPVLAESILYVVSYESVGIATALCEVFGVGLEIPPWVSNELLRLKELAEQVAAEREET